MKIQYAKPALTIEEQIKLLESRGMEIEDRDFAERALETVSYYRLSAYAMKFRFFGELEKTDGEYEAFAAVSTTSAPRYWRRS